MCAVATAARHRDSVRDSVSRRRRHGGRHRNHFWRRISIRPAQPIADATVKISGDLLPTGRTVQTGANGLYQFQYLTPGEYLVEIDKAGVGRSTRAAIVEVGKDTQVDFILGLSLQEEVTVSAARPIVDIRSAEVGFNFREDASTAFRSSAPTAVCSS